MKITIHQTHHTIADFSSIKEELFGIKMAPEKTIHLFPELFLTGYPLQDLTLMKSFYETYLKFLDEINVWSKSIDENHVYLLGGLKYELSDLKIPTKIYNGIFELSKKNGLKYLYSKQLLPNYDIFDEKKYFTGGTDNFIFEFDQFKLALLVCEDMWPSNVHNMDPCLKLLKEKNDFDAIINLSASPFDLSKNEKRLERAKDLMNAFNRPFIYVNRVGAEDEILFDGESFVLENKKTTILKSFVKDNFTFELIKSEKLPFKKTIPCKVHNTWESLFAPQLEVKQDVIELKKWTESKCETALKALQFGVFEYAKKSHFNKFLVALSGGMDSSLVLTILKLGLKEDQTLEAIYMPSEFSSNLSLKLSQKLCKNLNVPLYEFPITSLHHLARKEFNSNMKQNLVGLADENIQSRLRGLILYARSNQTGAMVINTSNKSELAVGYSTQYGDSVGAISMLGDLYKSEVYWLAEYINKTHQGLIPSEIITRPPSAELRENQKDSDGLPEYPLLDTILEGILSYQYSQSDLLRFGLDKKTVEKVFNLYTKSEYKRSQFCPIVKIKAKSFGFGYRVPINKNVHFFH